MKECVSSSFQRYTTLYRFVVCLRFKLLALLLRMRVDTIGSSRCRPLRINVITCTLKKANKNMPVSCSNSSSTRAKSGRHTTQPDMSSLYTVLCMYDRSNQANRRLRFAALRFDTVHSRSYQRPNVDRSKILVNQFQNEPTTCVYLDHVAKAQRCQQTALHAVCQLTSVDLIPFFFYRAETILFEERCHYLNSTMHT